MTFGSRKRGKHVIISANARTIWPSSHCTSNNPLPNSHACHLLLLRCGRHHNSCKHLLHVRCARGADFKLTTADNRAWITPSESQTSLRSTPRSVCSIICAQIMEMHRPLSRKKTLCKFCRYFIVMSCLSEQWLLSREQQGTNGPRPNPNWMFWTAF